MVDLSVGEWSQSSACIFSMNDPWRITAPTRSRANIDELFQYRDIIRRTETLSSILGCKMDPVTFRTSLVSSRPLSKVTRMDSSEGVPALLKLVRSKRPTDIPFVISRFANAASRRPFFNGASRVPDRVERQ